MKKTMILILFLSFLIIKTGSYNPNDLIFKGKCEDDKAKTGACMYSIYDSKNDYIKYAIFKKCGKGESCDDDYCIENVDEKKRKIGKSCNYDDDCISGLCVSNKCTANKEGQKCEKGSCEPGFYCNNDIKCAKYIKEGEKSEKEECLPGLLKDKENKCVKFGTIGDKEPIRIYDSFPYTNYNDGNLDLLCKSGFSHGKIDQETKKYTIICDSIKTEPECKEASFGSVEGKWDDDTPYYDVCVSEKDYKGTKIYYNQRYSKLKSKLYNDFLEDYKDLDLGKINSDEKNKDWQSGMKSKTKEKWTLYVYANQLKAAGIIDSEGKLVNDKKCEYEFLMKNYLNSNFIKFNTIIIAMIALLF